MTGAETPGVYLDSTTEDSIIAGEQDCNVGQPLCSWSEGRRRWRRVEISRSSQIEDCVGRVGADWYVGQKEHHFPSRWRQQHTEIWIVGFIFRVFHRTSSTGSRSLVTRVGLGNLKVSYCDSLTWATPDWCDGRMRCAFPFSSARFSFRYRVCAVTVILNNSFDLTDSRPELLDLFWVCCTSDPVTVKRYCWHFLYWIHSMYAILSGEYILFSISLCHILHEQNSKSAF